MKITMEVEVKEEDLKGLLCCAIEGGSNYWYHDLAPVLAKGLTLKDFSEGGKMQDPKDYWHWCQVVPLTEGCAVTLKADEDPKTYRLDRKAIEKGLKVFQEKCPRHFADFMADNTDANTGDSFLQCVLFGDVIYG
jgi:hypothetical protein